MTPEQVAACERLRAKYRDRFVVSEESGGHLWGEMKDLLPGEFCLFCSIMRRRDRQHGDCRGPHSLALRSST